MSPVFSIDEHALIKNINIVEKPTLRLFTELSLKYNAVLSGKMRARASSFSDAAT
ncbi:hypothetical protein GCM10027170_38410 [Aliiglaciecola aliphaticivorans]